MFLVRMIIILGGLNLKVKKNSKSCSNTYKDFGTVFVKTLNKQAPKETKIFRRRNQINNSFITSYTLIKLSQKPCIKKYGIQG